MKTFSFLTFFAIPFFIFSGLHHNHEFEKDLLNYKKKENDKTVFVTIDRSSIPQMSDFLNSQATVSYTPNFNTNSSISILEINESSIELLSSVMHSRFNRCGGFIYFDNYEEALHESTANEDNRFFSKNFSLIDYSVSQQAMVFEYIMEVKESRIQEGIVKLASFQNRYYESEHGLKSQQWLKKHWESILKGRSDAKVEFYQHQWKQPSVIATIKGSVQPDEVIVIGGHGDSIAGWFMRETVRAPGADDNASGISTITEIMRVLANRSYVPKRTIKFISYAAEEVGLRGSGEIAKDFRSKNVNVLGVLQFDMTYYKESPDYDIVLISDYTNDGQNNFLASLLDTYFKNYKWRFDQCGYACSDHASWSRQGFPASFPFASEMRKINRKIHTSKDLPVNSHSYQEHAAKFARLGLAYLIELDH